jgi:hypothetical protein
VGLGVVVLSSAARPLRARAVPSPLSLAHRRRRRKQRTPSKPSLTSGRLGLVHERERVLDVLEDVACVARFVCLFGEEGGADEESEKFETRGREEREREREREKKNAPSGPTNERSTLPLAAFFWLMEPPNMIHAAREVAETSLSLMVLMEEERKKSLLLFLNDAKREKEFSARAFNRRLLRREG